MHSLLKKHICAVIAAMLLLAAALFHAPLLRALASPLVVNQPIDSSDAIALAAWGSTPDGDHAYDAAKDLFLKISAENTKKTCILLVAPPKNRIEQIGVLPSFETLSRRELAARGIPADAIIVLHSKSGSDPGSVDALGRWLRTNPKKTVMLLCGDFHSGILRRALNTRLDQAAAERVYIRALFGRDCNAKNWWKFRGGFRNFGINWVAYLHSLWYGGTTVALAAKNADDYERDFLDGLGRKKR